MRLELQRLLAHGDGTLPHTCIVDVGAIGRWIHEAVGPQGASRQWADLAFGLSSAPRRIVWIAALPGRKSQVFGSTDLGAAVVQLRQLGVQRVVESSEPLTSMFAPERSPLAAGPPLRLRASTAVVGAQVEEYPEQLFVLEGDASAVLDVATGIVHTQWSQYRDRRGEAAFIPLIQAEISGDPKDPRGRPPGGSAAAKYKSELDEIYQGAGHPDAGERPEPVLPKYMRDSLWKNLERVAERAREIVGTGRDADARAALEAELQPVQGQLSVPVADPIVVLPVVTGALGDLQLANGHGFALVGTARREATGEQAVQAMLRDLVAVRPQCWIAPRALDLLGYMEDHGIPLPEAVVDPAHCAFVLCPDSIVAGLTSCPSALLLAAGPADWMWDVKRKTPTPSDISGLATALPQIAAELRTALRARGLDALINNDIAKTVPVLAAMERRGAWIRDDTRGTASLLQTEMGSMEAQFRAVVGDVAPYEASPEELIHALKRHGLTLPNDRLLGGINAKNKLARLAAVEASVKALLRARSLSNVQQWLLRLDEAGGRLRGRHFPEVTGRWGMNADALHAMPKHSPGAKAMRARLEGPPGTRLVAADFSSYEFRLVAGLSRDPRLLAAARQKDAIDYFARAYFGASYTPNHRAEMKRYLHPINYGAEEWGFVREQVAMPVADAVAHYRQLRQVLGPLFGWRGNAVAAARQRGFAQTSGGWQRDPRVAARGRSNRGGPNWVENAVVSTLVQGLAADILRWCLRELHRTLPSLDAELVFQNHDEIYVAVEESKVSHVQAELVDVLERRIQTTGLLPTGVQLVANVKKGTTWADLV